MLEMLWVGFSSRPTVAASFGAFDGWAAPVDGFIPETSVAPDLPPSPVAPLTHRFLKEISADPGVTSLTMKFACWHKAEMLILPGKCWRWQDPCKKSESEVMYFVSEVLFFIYSTSSLFNHVPIDSIISYLRSPEQKKVQYLGSNGSKKYFLTTWLSGPTLLSSLLQLRPRTTLHWHPPTSYTQGLGSKDTNKFLQTHSKWTSLQTWGVLALKIYFDHLIVRSNSSPLSWIISSFRIP